jgi:uncharacterized protein YbbC (DUF1343 family)
MVPMRPERQPVELARGLGLALLTLVPSGCDESRAALPEDRPGQRAAQRTSERVRLGIEELLDHHIDLIAGQRVALVTNPSGVDGNLVPTVDRLASDGRFELVRLFGPAHGIRGDVPAGAAVASTIDPDTGIEVVSLYGAARRPTAESLADVDAVLFDIQDVGARFYTYVSTLGEVARAAAETQTHLIVLDRPNPLGGLLFDGPVIVERWRSFIGWGPLPITHGMTVGEIALLYEEQLDVGAWLTVVPMSGWKRAMVWEDTGLDWTPTSPHIPRAHTAHLYGATALAASVTTNVCDAVGTALPFEALGAEWVDGNRLANDLAGRDLPGVRFQATAFRPFYGRHQGQQLRGVRLVLDDPASFEPVRTALAMLVSLRNLWPQHLALADETVFAKHFGNALIREMLVDGRGEFEIHASWEGDLQRFERARAAALIYD